jgi:large subunit ribosomal protein L10
MIKVGRLYREKLIGILKEESADTQAVFFVNFKGLTSVQLNTLRAALKQKSARLLVAKNRLIKKAFDDFEGDINSFLSAETGVVYSRGDIVDAAKALFDFTVENEKLEIKGGFVGQKTVSSKELKRISNLPPRNVLLGMAVNCIASPLTSLVGSLNQIILKFLWAVEEIRKKKEEKKT